MKRNVFYDILSENGVLSSHRLVYIVGHIIVYHICLYVIFTNTVNANNLTLIATLLGSLNGTKLIQKKLEKKKDTENNETTN